MPRVASCLLLALLACDRGTPVTEPPPTVTATKIAEIPLPPGYQRTAHPADHFASYLREFPLKKKNRVRLHTGRSKRNQANHYAVLDLDVGHRDLQQCADSVMRLRAEYLYAHQRYEDIGFHFESGHLYTYKMYMAGLRPHIDGDRVRFSRDEPPTRSRRGFRRYLELIFAYSSTRSLAKEIETTTAETIRAGDVFVQPLLPLGHAVIVIDSAVHQESGERIFLLAQGSTPAQDMEVLINPSDAQLSPWYSADYGDLLRTPEWQFDAAHLRRYAE